MANHIMKLAKKKTACDKRVHALCDCVTEECSLHSPSSAPGLGVLGCFVTDPRAYICAVLSKRSSKSRGSGA